MLTNADIERVRSRVWGDDPELARAAIAEAGDLGGDSAREILRAALADMRLDDPIRWRTVFALLQLGDLEALAMACEDPRQGHMVRSEAALALARTRTSSGDACIRRALSDEDAQMRRDALNAVRMANRSDMLADISRAEHDRNLLVRLNARRTRRALAP